jgi:hypothetical protein
MIKECDDCDTKFNTNTVKTCPSCHVWGKPIRSSKKREVFDYIRDDIKNKRRQVRSYRSSEVSKYERQTGKRVYESKT